MVGMSVTLTRISERPFLALEAMAQKEVASGLRAMKREATR
jgi:hypothetical protein